ncbi:hypothetical protein SSX86_032490 [Deinandra increscens subsp. villosa]|uniref:Uncharacterized protein n=1 Tax=Deinandra increscens subsp. villosa TaxID=3103831 RepID=A0AAP0C766_9ASTR
MGAQDLNQEHGDLLEIKSKYTNNCIQKIEAKKGGQKHHSNSAILKTTSRRNIIPTRKNAIKMIKRRRARRAGQEGSRKCSVVVKKIRTLKKLVPNAGSSGGLDGLFRETAEYISSLQRRVKIMQAVVDAFSNSE